MPTEAQLEVYLRGEGGEIILLEFKLKQLVFVVRIFGICNIGPTLYMLIFKFGGMGCISSTASSFCL